MENKLKKEVTMDNTTNQKDNKTVSRFLLASVFHVLCAIGASNAAGALWA